MKNCTGCNIEKPLSNFHKKGSGHHSRCKTCRNSSNREWYKNSNYKRVRTPNPVVKFGRGRKFWRRFYKKRLREATPPWVKTEFREQMEFLYNLRDDATLLTGEQYHLDHIIPLNHPEICGLNVPWNLQVLPGDINLKKSNYFNINPT
jgi:hypothetical protein